MVQRVDFEQIRQLLCPATVELVLGGSEKFIWKIFYRALFELGHQEVPEVHDPLEVPKKVYRGKVIRAKSFALVPLRPSNTKMGLLN